MSERHRILQSRGLLTLVNKTDRVSRVADGWGDFAFAPRPFVCTDCHMAEILPFHPHRPRPPMFPNHRYDLERPPLEVGNAASGHLPFLQLPVDVRESIYELLTEIFRDKKGLTKVEIGAVGTAGHRHCHPFRKGYEFRIPIEVKEDDSPLSAIVHRHLKRQDYQDILSLSQTSRQVRDEIGAVFWHKTSLDLDHWKYLLTNFLDDRPNVGPSIKQLRMEWSCDEDARDLDYSIIKFCKYIARRLVLDEMTFVLSTKTDIAREIISDAENISWVQAFRKIKIETLEVRLLLGGDQNSELASQIAVILRPAVSTAPVELSEQELYLRSR